MRPERFLYLLFAAWVVACTGIAAAAEEVVPAASAPATTASASESTASEPAVPESPTPAAPRPKPSESSTSSPNQAPTPALDLESLEEQLKETKAIGLFTKLALKNQVDDLLAQFRDHYDGTATTTMTQLRRSYDLLLMKVLSLIQDGDRKLAQEIIDSREAIWDLLSDPVSFSTLHG